MVAGASYEDNAWKEDSRHDGHDSIPVTEHERNPFKGRGEKLIGTVV